MALLRLLGKIRYERLQKGEFMRYLKYAVGEIVLVVLGILIALQINEWNEQRLDRLLADTALRCGKRC